MNEVWKPIPGYEERYEVSNFGRIRSLPYINYQASSHPGVMMEKHIPGKIMTPTDNGHGYLIVGLRFMGSKRKNHYVHRLVAEAFIPNPEGLKEINHIDYDKKNNSVRNLEWVSHNDNIDWSKEHMRKPTPGAPLTNIGMRYISIRKGRYRVNIHIKRLGYRLDKSFDTLDEAVSAREAFINGKEYFAAR